MGIEVPVLLIYMPFASLTTPSLALSLFKARLGEMGIQSKVLYLNFRFSRVMGSEEYDRISVDQVSQRAFQVGEWVFSGTLFEQSPGTVEQMLTEIRKDPPFICSAETSETDFRKYEGALLTARGLAGEFLDQAVAEVSAHCPKIVAFSSIFQQHLASLALARRIKERMENTFIIFGGGNCQGIRGIETLRRFPFVDAVVSGEGDVLFPTLVKQLLDGKDPIPSDGQYLQSSIPPISDECSFLDAPRIRNLDELPIPDFSDYFEELDQLGTKSFVPTLVLESSRGCWWMRKGGCNFCNLNENDFGFRKKSSERMLNEIERITDAYPARHIQMADRVLPSEYLRDLIPKLVGLRNRWDVMFYETRTNLTREQIHLLSLAGILVVQPGIESFSTDILNKINKGTTALQNIQMLKWCREFGINARYNLLWGIPGETAEEYRRMVELLPSLHHLQPPSGFHRIHVGRFSNYFERAEELGVCSIKLLDFDRLIYPFDDVSVRRLTQYFDYQCDQADQSCVAALEKAIRDWYSQQGTSRLFLIDAVECAFILDTRSVARNQLIWLDSIQRIVYRACEAYSDIGHIQESMEKHMGNYITSNDIQEELNQFIRKRLVIRDGENYLALAIPVKPEKTAEALQVVQSHFGGSSSKASPASLKG